MTQEQFEAIDALTTDQAREAIREAYLALEDHEDTTGAWRILANETIAYLEEKHDLAKENLWDYFNPERDRD